MVKIIKKKDVIKKDTNAVVKSAYIYHFANRAIATLNAACKLAGQKQRKHLETNLYHLYENNRSKMDANKQQSEPYSEFLTIEVIHSMKTLQKFIQHADKDKLEKIRTEWDATKEIVDNEIA